MRPLAKKEKWNGSTAKKLFLEVRTWLRRLKPKKRVYRILVDNDPGWASLSIPGLILDRNPAYSPDMHPMDFRLNLMLDEGLKKHYGSHKTRVSDKAFLDQARKILRTKKSKETIKKSFPAIRSQMQKIVAKGGHQL